MKNKNIFELDNLYAWCIVPFDKLERTHEERIEMIKTLGFKSYAYDWRNEHLDTMEEELVLAVRNNIEIKSVWMWIDGDFDSQNKLSEWNENFLKKIKTINLKTTIWLGFHENYFDELTHEQAVKKGVETIKFIASKANGIGCKVALYNHGNWIGEPENQIEIIEKTENLDIGIVYNFHHGHDQIDRFPYLLKIMMPYLVAININGMDKEGPKILTVGEGKNDSLMISQILSSGYKGQIGIIGHIEEEDVQIVLQRNLAGLKRIVKSFR